jgi:hypothetical protein
MWSWCWKSVLLHSILRHWIRGVVLLPQCDPSPTAVRENLRLCQNRPVGPRRSKWPRWAQPPTSPGRCGIAKPNSTDGPCQDLKILYLEKIWKDDSYVSAVQCNANVRWLCMTNEIVLKRPSVERRKGCAIELKSQKANELKRLCNWKGLIWRSLRLVKGLSLPSWCD